MPVSNPLRPTPKARTLGHVAFSVLGLKRILFEIVQSVFREPRDLTCGRVLSTLLAEVPCANHIHLYIYIYTHTHADTHVLHIHIYIYMHMHMHMYIYIYVYKYICIYIYMYVYVYVYIHPYLHIEAVV